MLEPAPTQSGVNGYFAEAIGSEEALSPFLVIHYLYVFEGALTSPLLRKSLGRYRRFNRAMRGGEEASP